MRASDYSRYAKGAFLLGLALFAIGGVGELVLAAGAQPVPAIASMVLFDMEVLGVAIGLFGPLTFGIVLPLVE